MPSATINLFLSRGMKPGCPAWRSSLDMLNLFRMRREFNVIIERDAEGYYVASVPGLRGCHTQARSLDKLLGRIKEAIELCLEVDGSGPAPSEFVGVQRVAVEA